MRVIPGMTVISPCDAIEAAQATEAALLSVKGPVYLRLSRPTTPQVNGEDYQFELGKGVVLADGKDTTIVATGLMVAKALKAREILLEKGIDAAVINIHTIKPIDSELIAEYAKKTGNMFTVEEHSVIGGLGSAVADVICEKAPCKLTKIGIDDKFGVSGPSGEVLAHFGLTPEAIAQKVEATLKA